MQSNSTYSFSALNDNQLSASNSKNLSERSPTFKGDLCISSGFENIENQDKISLMAFQDLSESLERADTEKVACRSSINDFDDIPTCFICFDTFSVDEPQLPLPCKNSLCQSKPVHGKCIYEWKHTAAVKNPAQNSSRRVSRATVSNVNESSCPLCRGPLSSFDFLPRDLIGSAMFSDIKIRRDFLMTPVPQAAGFVRCYIKQNIGLTTIRSKAGFEQEKMVYELYLQAPSILKYPLGPLPDSQSPKEGDKLLAIGNRTRHPRVDPISGLSKNTSVPEAVAESAAKNDFYSVSQIDLYLTDNNYTKKCIQENYIATVKSSLSGFKHELLIPVQNEMVPCQRQNAPANLIVKFNELCCVHFVLNKRQTTPEKGKINGPRRIKVCLPKLEALSSNRCDPMPRSFSQGSVVRDGSSANRKVPGKLSQALTYKSLNMLLSPNEFIFGRNKEPHWLDSIKAFSLDFKGRVILPSNKNFQLLLDSDLPEAATLPLDNVAPQNLNEDRILKSSETEEFVLQFGKVADTRDGEIFSMDFRFPLSPLQAFGICLGACDRNMPTPS